MADAQDPLLPDSASTRSTTVADIQTVHSRSSLLAWSSEVTRYQWVVLLVAWLGWVFDSMDGTLFSLVQKRSMTELMGPGATEAAIGFYSSVVFSVMLLGWAMGGICFGIIADYVGRTKALAATILIYSLFTGLSAAAQSWQQLAAFRFITGLGLGGEWAAGAALVAEVWPDHLRARAGAMLATMPNIAATSTAWPAILGVTSKCRKIFCVIFATLP